MVDQVHFSMKKVDCLLHVEVVVPLDGLVVTEVLVEVLELLDLQGLVHLQVQVDNLLDLDN